MNNTNIRSFSKTSAKNRDRRHIHFVPLRIEVDGKVAQVMVTEQDIREYREEIKDAL